MSEEKTVPDNVIVLKNVRLSFPALYVPVQFQGAGPFTYGAKLIVDKGSETDKAIEATILRVATAKWKDKATGILEGIRGNDMKFCYIKGDAKGHAGYVGKMVLGTKRKKDDGAPLVIDMSKTPIKQEAGKVYSGCYVNAKVQIWAQDSQQWGKGMRCTLITIQKFAEGEAFGGSGPANDDGMDEVATDSSEFE